MRRRTLLASLAVGLSSVAGCTSVPRSGTPTASRAELPAITVEYRLPDRLSSPIAEETLVVERDQLRYETHCTVTDSVGRGIEESLDADSYGSIQRLVVRSEPETWQSESCEVDCVVDDDDWDLAAIVDGERFLMEIDPQRGATDPLGLLVESLDVLATRFEDEQACLAANVEPPETNETSERAAEWSLPKG